MNVLLVSLCSKRALDETRRILDQFAERKGERTWATVITQDGLDTLRRLLRKRARRNTAVACHWLKSSGPELCWIVGNARRFNEQGTVPTNTTGRNILRSQDENRWHSGEAMALLAGIAGLFHDVGKANRLFQEKLSGQRHQLSEPLRHEWVSLRLFQAFVAGRDDKGWLTALSTIIPQDEKKVLANLRELAETDPQRLVLCHNPFKELPPLARVVGWLIVSHHRLPEFNEQDQQMSAPPLGELSLDSRCFDASWNSPQCRNPDWKADDWRGLWAFLQGTPFTSRTWCAKASRLALRALQCHSLWHCDDWLMDRFTSHLARLCLMLADHAYSAGPATEQWQDRDYRAFANTDRATGAPKQHLDEHNIGVGHNAYLLAKGLPQLRRHLPAITRHKGFKQRTQKDAFRWQDKAFELARSLSHRSRQQGFFGVNMASTGCGKTFANARIMYGLADEKLGCRFSVALGLRTLTLQTGDALAARLSLDGDDLAVMIGSSAVQQLHQLRKVETASEPRNGSESAEPLLGTTHVRYDGALDDGPLRRWLKQSDGLHALVSAPVLISTIDHLIPATEGTRGGKQIAPMLRLLTSDLVLDEPDDFGLEDLPALCRLVNWAGMLGSRVLLSSATLPPALINALFAAYQAGRAHYHRACGEPGEMPPVCCAWFDEFGVEQQELAERDTFKLRHEQFVVARLAHLACQPSLRQGALWPVTSKGQGTDEVVQAMATAIGEGMFELHQHHAERHASGKCVSVGLVRMANIDKLVAVSQRLLAMTPPPDTRLHFCVYHSHHPLLVRSAMEKRLDALLSRHQNGAIWQHPEVQQALAQPETHHLFVVFASPVAEVGRDHDYDWAIAEPSSMRSLIQLAGRIQRHRKRQPASPNLLILDRNFKALQGISPAYCQPGFESRAFQLASPAMADSLRAEQYHWIGAAPAIQMPPAPAKGPYSNLVALEHAHLAVALFRGEPQQQGEPLPVTGWWQSPVDWCAEMQRRTRFRASRPDDTFVLYREDEEDPLCFHRLDEGAPVLVERSNFERQAFVPAERVEPGLANQPEPLLEVLAEQLEWDAAKLSRTFTEIRLPRAEQAVWQYDPLFGIYRILKNVKRG